MARLILAELADSDAADIIEDLGGKAGAIVANRYDAAFDYVYRRLESFPETGAPRPKLGKQVRVCIVLPYLLLYEYLKSEDLIIVLRILHGKRKITKRVIKGRG